MLDVDICGPSIPKVMGLEGEQVKMGWLFLFFILYFKCIFIVFPKSANWLDKGGITIPLGEGYTHLRHT